ncbi:MAG: hypothetical protein WEG36_14435 [Gemmatimonadota bacterium]
MRLPILLSALLTLAACAADPIAPEPLHLQAAKVGPDLQAVRAATARFSSFEQAEKGAYTFLFGGSCFSDPTEGAMGYHYVNTSLLDAVVDPLQPEAVMYEPQANGSLKLVGLEYVVPGTAWTNSEPPRLFGQDYSFGNGLYTLHVWLWQTNPNGMFTPWNPTVSCANAAAALSAEHDH